MKKITFALFLTCAFLPGQQVKSGLSFLQLDVGARGAALGGSGASFIGPEALFYNPSGLATIHTAFALFTHSRWINNVNYDYLSYGQPLPYGFICLGLKGLYADGLEKRTAETTDPIGTFGVFGFCGTIGYSYSFLKKISLGASLDIVNQTIDTYSGFTVGCDLGIHYTTPLKGYDVGLAVNDLGPRLKLHGQSVNLPTKIRLGISYFPALIFPGLYLDFSKDFNSGVRLASGLEYCLYNLVSVRAAYTSDQGIALGFGITYGHFNLDYGFRPYSGLGFTHRITLIYNWTVVQPIKPEDQMLTIMRMTGERYYNDGLAALSVGNFEEAKRDFDIASIWDSKNNRAAEKYEEAERKGRERAVSEHLARAQKYFDGGNFLEAVAELEYVINIDTTRTQAKLLLAQSQTRLGKPLLGGSDFEAGLNYYGQGRYRDAISAWQKVANQNPDRTDIAGYIDAAKGKLKLTADSLVQDGIKFEQLGLHKQAINSLNQALTVDPENRIALSKLGEIRNSMLRETGAHLSAGIEYFDKRDYVKAESEFQSVLTLSPNNRDAREYINRIKNIKSPTHADLRQKNISAISAYVAGDYETAIRLFEEILNDDPNFPDARRGLDRARAMLQKMGK